MACTAVEKGPKFVSCYLDDYYRVNDGWISHLRSGHPRLTCLLTITDLCVMFFGTMTARNFAVTLDCSVFWSGAVETELLCRQDVFPFIKRCHAMTLETSVRGVLRVHARTCLLRCITSPSYLITSRLWRFISMIFTWFHWISTYPGAQCVTMFDKIPVLPIVVVADQISANPSYLTCLSSTPHFLWHLPAFPLFPVTVHCTTVVRKTDEFFCGFVPLIRGRSRIFCTYAFTISLSLP